MASDTPQDLNELQQQWIRMSSDIHHIKEKIDELVKNFDTVFENKSRLDRLQSEVDYMKRDVSNLKMQFWGAVVGLISAMGALILFIIKNFTL